MARCGFDGMYPAQNEPPPPTLTPTPLPSCSNQYLITENWN